MHSFTRISHTDYVAEPQRKRIGSARGISVRAKQVGGQMSVEARLLKNEGGLESELRAKSPIDLVFQLGAELDSGTLRYLKTEAHGKGMVAPLAHYNVSVRYSPTEWEIFWYVGTDNRALARADDDEQGIYSHEVALVEPSKTLEGVLIDGIGVTQPEAVDKRDSLFDVVTRLLDIVPFDYGQSETAQYSLTVENKVVYALKNIKSPQFKWNTQNDVVGVPCANRGGHRRNTAVD